VLQSPLLVIDKSFAHAIAAERLANLSTKYCLLVPSGFYYEVFDPESAKLLQTLTGFGEFRRVDISTLLRRETRSAKPTREIDLSRRRINTNVISCDWKLPPDESAAIQRYKRELIEPSLRFWNAAIDQGVIGFSSGELKAVRGTPKEFLAVCETLRDRKRVRMIAAEIGFVHASILSDGWLHYRKFQTWILQGLILWRRHQIPGDVRSIEKIEHDITDIEYLMLGLHAGSLATAETSEKLSKGSLGWRFKLLKPEGRLLTPALA